MLLFKTILFLLFFIVQSVSFSSEKRNQVEELFIWKISDELKLSSKEEQRFAGIYKDLTKKRADLNQEIQELLIKKSSLSEEEAKSVLQNYRQVILKLNRLNESEFDELQKVFGAERMFHYLKIKQDLNLKLKSALIQGDSDRKSKKSLPRPQIIEEK